VKHEFYRNVGEHDLYGDTKEYADIPEATHSSGFGREPGADTPATAEEKLATHQSDAALRKAILSLEFPVREIFLLLVDRELKLEEISGILSIPVGTIKSHIHRGKEKLRSLLTNEKVTNHE
jgi:RNA polymerase sigma factor (sigma-70 family)